MPIPNPTPTVGTPPNGMEGVADAMRRHGVRQAWVFGSRSRGQAGPGSDWDFLVDFAVPPDFSRFMGLKLLLEDQLGAKVDLLSLAACKPRFLQAIQPELQRVA